MKKQALLLSLLGVFIGLYSCQKEKDLSGPNLPATNTTPYHLSIPAGFPQMIIPANNPMTVEGVALGRRLFYDVILSGDNTISCASCHIQSAGFTDSLKQFSLGIDAVPGTRNSMPLQNLGWDRLFFWDGGASNLESQVAGPIENPVEMHETLANAIQELNAHPTYPGLFKQVFGELPITSSMLLRAVAQFERTLISGNSRYDRYARGEVALNDQELRGLDVFTSFDKGDCTHCHVLGSTMTDFEFRNTGLDSIYADEGRARITLSQSDVGKFKTPSLRNITVTAPYMHDGRFATLMECIDHYNTGFHYHPNLDPLLATATKGRMTQQDKEDLLVFLETFTDVDFLTNPEFSQP